jgi:DNA-binding MarR family transcriptional regulator
VCPDGKIVVMRDDVLDRIIVTLRRLRRSARWQTMHRDAYKLADGSSLSVAQVDALEALIAVESSSIKDLAALLLVDSSNLSRTVASLVALNLVARVEDRTDRRAVELTATSRGRRAHEQIARRRREQLRAVLGPMERDRCVLLAELLEEYFELVESSKDEIDA